MSPSIRVVIFASSLLILLMSVVLLVTDSDEEFRGRGHGLESDVFTDPGSRTGAGETTGEGATGSGARGGVTGAPEDQPDGTPARPGSERAYYEALVQLARKDPRAFRERYNALSPKTATMAERVAALRAWHDGGVKPAFAAFESVLSRPGSEIELRDFTVRFLVGRAQHEKDARRVLGAYAMRGPDEARLRGSSLAAVFRWGDDLEVSRCRPALFEESDLGVLDQCAAALAEGRAPTAASTLAELKQNHPDPKVREHLGR